MPGIIVATLLGLVLRCIGLATDPFSYDEGATLYFARLPWSDLVGPPALLEPNPPLFYAFAHLAVAAFGEREWVLRLPSVIAGTLCIPVAAILAGRTGRVAAAFLVATSAIGVLSSQDARAYAMLSLALLAAAAALLVLVEAHRARRPEPTAWAWTAFVLAEIAVLYLHNTAVLLLATLNLAALLAAPGLHRGFLRRLVVADLVVLAAWMPWLPVVAGQLPGAASNAWMTVPSLSGLRYAVLGLYGQPWLDWPQPWLDAAFLAAGTLGVLLAAGNRVRLGLGVFLLACVPVASWGISQWRPIMNGKTLLPLAPVFLVFAGIACGRLGRPGAVVAAALVGIQLWACRHALTDRPEDAIPTIAATLAARAEPGDRLYLARPELEVLLDYYGWPRDRLDLIAPRVRPPWFRHGTASIGEPAPGGRLWVLTRSNAALHRATAAALTPAMTQQSDELVGRGRSRTLELSLFVPP